MKKLKVSLDLSLPLDAVTQRISFLGRTGSGKTYSAGVLIEEILKAGQQVVVLDPKGDWWGLRASADGKGPGLPITILGGEHGDAPLLSTAGKVIAEMVVHEGISAVLDLSLFESKAQECRFATDFAERLYRLKLRSRGPVMFMVDEADQFAPQRPMHDENLMLSKFELIARRGRRPGIGLIICSQRSAAIHKGVLSQTEVMVAHQTTSPHDKKAIMEWMQDKGTEEQQKEFLKLLPALKRGDALVWSPSWLEIYKKLRFRRKETFDSSATPEVGMSRKDPKVLAEVDLERLKKHMAETIERAKENDPAELKRKIAQLMAELGAAKRGVPTVVPKATTKVETKTVGVPVLSKQESNRVKLLADAVTSFSNKLGELMQQAKGLDALRKELNDIKTIIGIAGARFSRANVQAQKPSVLLAKPPVPIRPRPLAVMSEEDGELTPKQRRILEVLGEFEALGQPEVRKTMVAALVPCSHRSSAYTNNLGALRSRGYIEYGAGGTTARRTDKGQEAVPPMPPPTSTAEILERCLRVCSSKQAALLKVAHEAYPDVIGKEELAQQAGCSPTSSAFTNNLGALRSAGMFDYVEGGIRCQDWMFLIEPTKVRR